MIFRIFGIFLMFLGFVSLVLRRTKHQDGDKLQDFWKRENASNLALPQDIEHLNYVDFSGTTLPFSLFSDDVLTQCEQQVLELRNQKILNLNGISNTDLKLQYGVSNLSTLTRYDQNFILLVRTLNQWGHRLYELSYHNEAKTVLLFAVSIGSDIKSTYELLLNICLEAGETAAIEELKYSAEKLTSTRKDAILSLFEKA